MEKKKRRRERETEGWLGPPGGREMEKKKRREREKVREVCVE